VKPTLLAAALAALLLSPAALAHEGGPKGFTSTVTRVTPATQGLRATILQGDDRIGLRNTTGQTILVYGYTNEPYLRITPHAVYRNARSPATYLNEVRFADQDVDFPEDVSAKAPPEWKQVADGPYYEWHDHRIHWMNPILPPQVRSAKDEPHHIFDWSVPIRVAGEPGSLQGTLDYAPPPSSSFNALLVVPLAAIVLAGAGAWWWRRRRPASGESAAR
jgi:hypothetical protein